MPDDAAASTVDIGSADLPRAPTDRYGEDPVSASEASVAGRAEQGVRPHIRLIHGMRRPANWLQLVQFGIVGASGFAINLAVYAFFVNSLGINYLVAAAAAWIIAGCNNFIWNRHWTFKAREGQIHGQAWRFLLVSLAALGINEAVLHLLVETGGLDKVLAQVVALAVSTPFNFLGNKLWIFRTDVYSGSPPAQED
jgi:putative flippase GtrA